MMGSMIRSYGLKSCGLQVASRTTLFVIPKDDEVEIGHERKRTGEAISCKAGQKALKI
jgi:hypothetical protein